MMCRGNMDTFSIRILVPLYSGRSLVLIWDSELTQSAPGAELWVQFCNRLSL